MILDEVSFLVHFYHKKMKILSLWRTSTAAICTTFLRVSKSCFHKSGKNFLAKKTRKNNWQQLKLAKISGKLYNGVPHVFFLRDSWFQLLPDLFAKEICQLQKGTANCGCAGPESCEMTCFSFFETEVWSFIFKICYEERWKPMNK